MTTIYLTQHQYQQVLDGMITTHLDVANVGTKVDMKSAEINALKAQIDAKKAELASL